MMMMMMMMLLLIAHLQEMQQDADGYLGHVNALKAARASSFDTSRVLPRPSIDVQRPSSDTSMTSWTRHAASDLSHGESEEEASADECDDHQRSRTSLLSASSCASTASSMTSSAGVPRGSVSGALDQRVGSIARSDSSVASSSSSARPLTNVTNAHEHQKPGFFKSVKV